MAKWRDWIGFLTHTGSGSVSPLSLDTNVEVTFAFLDNSDVESKLDNCRIENVRGTSFIGIYQDFASGPAWSAEVLERIYIINADEAGFPEYSPNLLSTSDYDRHWLWERRFVLECTGTIETGAGIAGQLAVNGQNNMSPHTGTPPYYNYFDLRNMRRIEGREMLIYHVSFQKPQAAVGASGFSVGQMALVSPRVRVLVAG